MPPDADYPLPPLWTVSRAEDRYATIVDTHSQRKDVVYYLDAKLRASNVSTRHLERTNSSRLSVTNPADDLRSFAS